MHGSSESIATPTSRQAWSLPEAASGAARGESGGGTGSSAAVSGSNRARADELKPLKLKAGTFSQCGHAPASAKHPS
jgi:hypothetical protein